MNRDQYAEYAECIKKDLEDVEKLLAKPAAKVVSEELPNLQLKFWATSIWLALALAGSLAVLYLAISCQCVQCAEPYALASISGFAGSSVSALLSINARYAAGIEFSDGTRFPDQERKERFNARLVPGFVFRPLLGALAGLLLYCALLLEFFGKENTPNEHVNVLLFWSILGGLFAKSLLTKLKQFFESLVGKSSK